MKSRLIVSLTGLMGLAVGCGSDEKSPLYTDENPQTGDGDIGDGDGGQLGPDGGPAGGNPDSGSLNPGPGNASDGGTNPGDADGGTGPGPTPGCLGGIADYAAKGPFTYRTATSGSVKFWVPDVPAGCKVPVVHLANGTGARCVAYSAILEHLASHGFLATCFEDTNTGQGTQCIEAIETAYAEYPDLADDKIGSTGHSQGGGAAVVCVYRAEAKWGTYKIYAGHAMEPAHGFGDAPANYAALYAQIESPIFMFNGSADSFVSSAYVGQGFRALADSTEAYWYEASGAAHIPVPTRWTQESATAWFRWKLLGDSEACEYFKALPDGDSWSFKQAQNETDC
jgi:hypothetical protein